MKKLIPVLLLLSIFNNLSAQNFEWVRGYETDYQMNPDMLRYNVCTSPGGVVWHGGLKHLVEFYNEAMGDLFIAAYDSEGNRDIDLEITGSAMLIDMESDEAGNLYIAGQYRSDLQFWDGQILEFSGPFINGFIVKMSPDGNIHWIVNLSLLFEEIVPEDIFISNDHMFLAHSEWSESNITEFDSEGNVLQSINQMSVNLVTGVVVDGQGNIFATGSCPQSNATFGGVAFSTPFAYSQYLVKYSSAGIPEWVKFVEDVTCISPKIALTGDGKVIWSGPLFIETDFDTITLMGPSWSYDLFVTAFNTDGHALWGFEVPQVLTGDASTGRLKPIQVLPDNSVAVAGFTRGTVDWGNNVISGTTGFDYESMILNISSDGVANWVRTSIGEGYNQAVALASDPSGNLFMTGTAHGTIQFDTCSFTGISYYYPYLAKLSTEQVTGVSATESEKSMGIYPNPARNYIMLQTDFPVNSFIIRNTTGSVVMNGSIKDRSTRVDISKLKSGIYFISAGNSERTFCKKLIIR